MHRLAPAWPLVALTNYDFLQVGKPGASPWLGGLDADDFGGDFVRAAATIPGVAALSPVYGFPQDGKISDPAFRFYVTEDMVSEAHALGLKVVPWTCDDPATIEALMDMGIDGVITNYPNRVRQIMADRGMRLPKAYEPRRPPGAMVLPAMPDRVSSPPMSDGGGRMVPGRRSARPAARGFTQRVVRRITRRGGGGSPSAPRRRSARAGRPGSARRTTS